MYKPIDLQRSINSTNVRLLSRWASWLTRRINSTASLRTPGAPVHRPNPPRPGSIVTANGTTVRLRLLQTADRPALRSFFQQLSPRSRQQRFLVPRPALTEQELDWLLTLRPGSHWSWVAEYQTPAGAHLVGVAQGYHGHTAPGSAEIAVAVLDAFQGQGIGRYLLAAVAAEALEVGIRQLHGYTLAENRRIRGYGERRGAESRTEDDGTIELRFAASRLAADRAPDPASDAPASAVTNRHSEVITRLPLTEGF